MSVVQHDSHEHHHVEETFSSDAVYHQFEDLPQQQESYVVGMWTFLVTEVMFFGPLFFCYALFRWKYQPEFYIVHKELSVFWGGLNTTILLASSFFVAMAVHTAQKRLWAKTNMWLGATLLCAFGFLVIKGIEWTEKYQHHLIPGMNFEWHGGGVPQEIAHLFFLLYFFMTGLHGIHVVIGIIVIGALMILIKRQSKVITDYIPVEMVGLYWHFVDLVWIFLFPLFYLLPR
jgi:cytochrome c oxidase subunit III